MAHEPPCQIGVCTERSAFRAAGGAVAVSACASVGAAVTMAMSSGTALSFATGTSVSSRPAVSSATSAASASQASQAQQLLLGQRARGSSAENNAFSAASAGFPVVVGATLLGLGRRLQRRLARRAGRRRGASRGQVCALRALPPGSSPAGKIRNFSIIAHIDHGKSTLADRMLEATGTVSKTDMQAQVLDTLDIERERGITIKLNTARMDHKKDGEEYVLNLIDTPGHVDFTYEVSRSLAACEGALLVVDATQGVQAQTIANVALAMDNDLEIIVVLNKTDLPHADPDRVKEEIEDILGIECDDALLCSAKTGKGVPEIIDAIVDRIPPPKDCQTEDPFRALIYDSFYDNYQGVIVLFRIVEGSVKKGQTITFAATRKEYVVDELGYMVGGKRISCTSLGVGEVGYISAAVKTVSDAQVGDTVMLAHQAPKLEALPGYAKATPMVFCGLFPEDEGNFDQLRTAFERLALNDAALSFEVEKSTALGLGFRCGFLGILHMEVIKERLEREYGVELAVTTPSVQYQLLMKDGSLEYCEFASQLPEPAYIAEIREPFVHLELIMPEEHINACMELSKQRRAIYKSTSYMSQGRVLLTYEMPLAEMIRDFFSKLKSVSHGYASMDYRVIDSRAGDLVKLEVDVNKTTAHPLSQIVHRSRALALGKKMVAILQDEIPAQQIKVFIQARIGSMIVASSVIKAIRKNVLAKCYGGDVTRKLKLLKKQAEGKKKMQDIGRVSVPGQAIISVIKKT
eukprot:TRINITY_DN18266_c0_g1_i1.p1 TRINITY_DN18266_c0_g1~~TRINITY_DN18266_c0_g1_i1.p1  ORF type:complete len:747 (+),score=202.82 TRINITY_DN18266_c0_g1_i1:92-2332(+)